MGLGLSLPIRSTGAKVRCSSITLRHGRAQTQKSRYRRLPTSPIPDVGFLGRVVYGEGSFLSDRGAVAAPARGQPKSAVRRRPAAWSAGSTSPLGRPRAEQMAGEASGSVSCCYLSLMTRSVNSVGNTPSCLCMPPALITVIEL